MVDDWSGSVSRNSNTQINQIWIGRIKAKSGTREFLFECLLKGNARHFMYSIVGFAKIKKVIGPKGKLMWCEPIDIAGKGITESINKEKVHGMFSMSESEWISYESESIKKFANAPCTNRI